MAKNDTNELIKNSITNGKIDDEKTNKIANNLNRKSLKQYVRILKKLKKKKKVIVEIPLASKDEFIKDIAELFPNKTVIIREDPTLLLGLRITSEDDVLELNLKHEFEKLIQYISNDELNPNKTGMVSEDQIIKQLEERLSSYSSKSDYKFENTGRVDKNNDGVITASGLSKVTMGELVSFETENISSKTMGFVLNLSEDTVSIILLGSATSIKEGDRIQRTNTLLSIPVSEELIGRVVDPLGEPIDGKSKIKNGVKMPLERIAVGVVEREPVDTPLKTGIKAIDSMIPVGRGQRELIIGDRGLGKTAIAIDTILNQKTFNKPTTKQTASEQQVNHNQRSIICIYVAIGQKQSSIAQTIEILRKNNAMDYTIVVAAPSSSPAALQYLAPYSGTAIAEYFMEKGQDVLIVYDDLTKHAWAYRQLSLVLQRPAGREAYPGDIFYLHSRLLERSVKLNKKNGGGSITSLPIIETQASDMSAYIPTNVISITDGQIYLEQSLFNVGVRPAINPGNSVSRVGGAAQTKAIKSVAGKLRLELAQYNSLAAFAQFGSELDEATLKQLERGKRIVEILKQSQFSPLSEALEILSLWSATNGLLDDIPVENVSEFETQLHDYAIMHEQQLLKELDTGEKLSEKTIADLRKTVEQFKKGFKII